MGTRRFTGSVRGVIVVAAMVALWTLAGAQEKAERKRKRIRTQDAAEAGADFLVQGEYAGSIERDGAKEALGVQVVALGNGSFDAHVHSGGLPGAGWERGGARRKLSGKTAGGRTVFEEDGEAKTLRLVVAGGRLEVEDAAGATLGRLERVERKSPTLGKKPPEGAVVLFDGTSAEHFVTRRGGRPAEMTADGLLRLTRGSGGLDTRRSFGSCSLHLEFRLPFEPEGRGQGRGNSGCYLQGRYEVQILDSFGLEGTQSECGGVYSSGVHPRVNMCFPPLSWQTFDIDFTAAKYDDSGKKTADARLAVRHNGVLVYEDQVIGHKTTAAPRDEEPSDAPHYLQDHGHELHFRNIWLVER